MEDLKKKKVAILLTNGFEEVEFTKPKKALEDAGADVVIVAPEKKIKAWYMKNWGSEYEVDVLVDEAQPGEYDALMLPGE